MLQLHFILFSFVNLFKVFGACSTVPTVYWELIYSLLTSRMWKESGKPGFSNMMISNSGYDQAVFFHICLELNQYRMFKADINIQNQNIYKKTIYQLSYIELYLKFGWFGYVLSATFYSWNTNLSLPSGGHSMYDKCLYKWPQPLAFLYCMLVIGQQIRYFCDKLKSKR